MPKKVRRPRPEHERGKPVPIELLSIFEVKKCTVRFLGEPLSCLTHWTSKGSVACPGKEECKTETHRSRTMWKAYAPVERWRDVPHEDWLPEVLEITENLWRAMKDHDLRAEIWTLFLQVSRFEKNEVWGEHVDTINADHLRQPFDVKPTVFRIYRTIDIQFGVESYLPAVPVLEPSAGARPKNLVGLGQTPKVASPSETKEFARRQKERLQGIGAMPNGDGNGKAH